MGRTHPVIGLKKPAVLTPQSTRHKHACGRRDWLRPHVRPRTFAPPPPPVHNCQPQTKTNSSRPGGTQGSHLFLQSGYGGSRFVLLEVVVFLSVALAPGPVRARLVEEEEEKEDEAAAAVSQLCLHPADVINPPLWSIFKQRLRTSPRTRAPPAWKMPLLSYARVYHKHTAHFCPIGGASALLSSRHLQHKHDLMSQHNASL